MDQPVPDNWWVFFSFLFFLYFFSICTIILFLLLLSLQMLLLTEIFLTYVVGIFEAYRFSYCFLFYTVLGAWQPECVNVAISDFEFSPKAGAWRQCRKVKTKRERTLWPIYIRSSKFFDQCYLLDWLKFILHILLQNYCISSNKVMQVSNICSLEKYLKSTN